MYAARRALITTRDALLQGATAPSGSATPSSSSSPSSPARAPSTGSAPAPAGFVVIEDRTLILEPAAAPDYSAGPAASPDDFSGPAASPDDFSGPAAGPDTTIIDNSGSIPCSEAP